MKHFVLSVCTLLQISAKPESLTKVYATNTNDARKVPYFFGHKTELFSFQNKPKDLALSYKMDLDLWDCLGRVKLVL